MLIWAALAAPLDLRWFGDQFWFGIHGSSYDWYAAHPRTRRGAELCRALVANTACGFRDIQVGDHGQRAHRGGLRRLPRRPVLPPRASVEGSWHRLGGARWRAAHRCVASEWLPSIGCWLTRAPRAVVPVGLGLKFLAFPPTKAPTVGDVFGTWFGNFVAVGIVEVRAGAPRCVCSPRDVGPFVFSA